MARHISGDSQAEVVAAYKAAQATNPISGMTPAEVDAWINANVNTLSEAKVALRRVGAILAVHDAVLDALVRRVNRLEQA